MSRLTIEKFANEVLPLMLSEMAQGRKPGLPVTQPEALDPPAQVSNPNVAANGPLPQGPTAVNSPAVPAPVQVEPHTLGPQKAAGVNAGALSEPTAALANSAKRVLGAVLRKVTKPTHSAAAAGLGAMGLSTSKSPRSVKEEEKEAGLAQIASAIGKGATRFGKGAFNFGRGAYAVTQPVTGLLRGGLPGAAKGTAAAAKNLYKGGVPALLGAGTVLSSLQSPVVTYGDGIKLRSPIAPPPTRFRAPVEIDSSGIRFQKPWVN